MKVAIYPGSFDPLTNGHVDVAKRAKKLFDKVIILVSCNSTKSNTYMFSVEERVTMAKKVFKEEDGYEVISSSELVVDVAKKLGAHALIRGLRAVADYEYEYQLYEVNNFLDPDIDMIYFMAKTENTFISSSNIKELIKYKKDVRALVPTPVWEELKKKI